MNLAHLAESLGLTFPIPSEAAQRVDFSVQEWRLLMLAALDAGASGSVTVAGENHIGSIGGHTAVVPITFSLDTAIYATGDVLADTQILNAAMRKVDGTGLLHSIMLVDKDDQGIAMEVVILDANSSLGAENAASAITDANADNILGIIKVESSDWIDLGGAKVALLRNLGLPVKAVATDDALYVGLITRGAPTHTAAGITGRFGFLLD